MAETRRKVSLAVMLLLIVVLGITFFRVVAPFILPLFLAGMTAVICQPLFRYFLMRTKDRIPLAAGLTTATIMASILIPLVTAIVVGSLQLYTFASRISDDRRWLMAFRVPEIAEQEEAALEATEIESPQKSDGESSDSEIPKGETIDESQADEPATSASDDVSVVVVPVENDPPVEMDAETTLDSEVVPLPPEVKEARTVFEDVVIYVNGFLPKELQRSPASVAQEIRSRVRVMMQEMGDRSLGRAAGTTFGVLAGVAGAIVSALIAIMMYVVALYYFLADGTTLLLAAEKLIPVHAKYQRELLNQFALVVRSVVVATFLAAFAQGIATTAALWFFGFDHLVVLLLLAMMSALIPIAGTWLVWLPCAVILFATGHWLQAVLLTIYGAAFVGFLDNIVRTYVLNSDTKLHPLLAFISILGGLQVMGLWGVFFGPIVASCLHALIKIFNHELLELTIERTPNVTS